MVKFPAREEARDAGAIEYAYSLMAKAAGMEVPATHLFETAGGRYFAVQRFDRHAGDRFHIHSFGNLLQADFRIPSCDYLDFLKATALLTRKHLEVVKGFRWMVFNVLAHNRDDHAKNFAYRLHADTGEWSLTPAFDLSFSQGPGGEHSMTLAGEGRNPGPAEFQQVARERGIADQDAARVVEEVRDALRRWPEFAAQAGVGRARLVELKKRF